MASSKVSNVLVNSKSVNKDSTVLINLSNNQSSKRINVNENVTLGDLGIDSIQQALAPQFPTDQVAKINSSSMTGAEKAKALSALMQDHQKAQEGYALDGGMSLEDQIVAGVIKYLCTEHGFSTSDGGGSTKVIKPSDLLVTAIPVCGSTLMFSVSGTACWGSYCCPCNLIP
jgi:hypothetical protein